MLKNNLTDLCPFDLENFKQFTVSARYPSHVYGCFELKIWIYHANQQIKYFVASGGIHVSPEQVYPWFDSPDLC